MIVGDRIHRLTGGIVNFYLVEEGGKLVLVDAGTPRDWDEFARGVTQLRRTIDDLDAVLLTHAHSDHTGFAERARTESHAQVRIHAADAKAAKTGTTGKNEAGVGRYLLRVEAYRTLFSLMRRGGTKIVPILEVSTFADGETLDVPGRPRVVHTPGHTPGTCAVVFEERRAVMTGDALVLRNPMTGRRGPQIMPGALNNDSQQALRSLDVLASLPVDILLPGHGDPWTGPAADAVRAARAAGPS